MNDNEIIELFWERAEQAIVELANKYGNTCLQLSMNILANARDAEECVNDAYLGVWNSIPPNRPEYLPAYIFRMVKNLSINRYKYNNAERRKSNLACNIDELEMCISRENTPEDAYNQEELTHAIESFIARLDEINRMIFVRHFWYMDSYEIIAQKTGLHLATIRARVSRTKKALIKHLIKEGFAV